MLNKKQLQEKLTELEGQEIFVRGWYGKKHIGIITGADYYVGLTLQDKNNKDIYLFCLHSEYSPLRDKNFKWNNHMTDEIEIIYNMFIDYCKKDYFDLIDFMNEVSLISEPSFDASADACVFNQ